MTKYYRCMHYESEGCTARPIVSENKVKEKGVHNSISQQGNLQVEASKYLKQYTKRQASDLLSIPVDCNNNSFKKKNKQSDTIQHKQRNKSLALRICRNSAIFP
ncbi:hypothetical protein MXB_5039 [Myxobolus squamalis]|nr:hypothetical protein MXB_5039 [Myxobolus squamalis]